MRFSYFTYIIIALMICACSRSGTTDDSDEREAYRCLELACELDGNEKYDSAMAVINKGLGLKNVSDSTRGMLNAEMSTAYNLTGDMNKALVYGRKAMQLCRGTIDPESFAILSGNVGIVYRRLGMNDSAAICYKVAVEEAMKCEGKSSLAYLYNNLSVLYCEMERYGESISYAKKSQANALLSKDTIEYCSALANEGINYAKQGNNRKAVDMLGMVFDKADSINSTPLKLKVINYLLSAYRELGDNKQTDKYLARGEQIAETFPRGSIAVNGIYESKVNILVARGRYAEALEAAKQLENNGGLQTMPAYKMLRLQARCHAGLGDYAKAYRLEKEAEAIQDSVSGKTIEKQLSEYSVRFKTQEKELEISRLQKEKADEQAFMMLIVAVLTFVIAVLAIVLIWINHRRKIRKQQTEIDMTRKYIDGMESERARLARDLHDGACNELLAIGMELRDGNTGKDRIINHVQSLRASLRHISHEMMPPSFQYAELDETLRYYIGHLLKPDSMKMDYRSEGTDWEKIPQDTACQLYRITQEAVSNIIRHSAATHAEVGLTFNNDGIHLIIKDNGKGHEEGARSNGGVKSMRDRAESIKADFTWKSDGNGTTVEVLAKAYRQP